MYHKIFLREPTFHKYATKIGCNYAKVISEIRFALGIIWFLALDLLVAKVHSYLDFISH